jgi:hypothetical protein
MTNPTNPFEKSTVWLGPINFKPHTFTVMFAPPESAPTCIYVVFEFNIDGMLKV